MRRTLGLVALIIAFSSAVPQTQNDGPWSVRYLTAQPVSLFEWGLVSLEGRLAMLSWTGVDLIQRHFSRAQYDRAQHTLQILLTVYPRAASLTAMSPHEVCRSLINQTKDGIAAGPDTSRKDVYGIAAAFTHLRSGDLSVPPDFTTDLERITVVEVKVWNSMTDKPPYKLAVTCSSRLTNRDIAFVPAEAK